MAKSSGSEKYAYLNRLSTEQLEELLRADIESPESGDVDVIFHILEVIEKREEEHPTAASLTRTGLGQSSAVLQYPGGRGAFLISHCGREQAGM